MPKIRLTTLLILMAAASFLTGIISKVGILPREFLDIRHNTYVDMAQLFLLAAIAVKLCLVKAQAHKDGGPCCK